MADIILGSPEQIRVIEQATALRALLKDDPRFAFQGRANSLTEPTKGGPDLVISLSRLQGYSSCHFVPRDQAEFYSRAYQAAGLQSLQWEQYWGRETALTQSRAFLASYAPPAGLTLKTVTADTPDSTVKALCQMSLEAGVLPAPGSTMRGDSLDGLMIYAETEKGEIVATGGAFMAYHPRSNRADEAFWGMLATRDDWRGNRLACWVGAQVILDMAQRYGAKGFSSGVKADNPASQAMCSRIGVARSDYVYAGAVNPQVMGGTSVTR
ncbi:hypothetical protein ACTL6U_19190 [Rhodovibrionaceae bacterium A322]